LFEASHYPAFNGQRNAFSVPKPLFISQYEHLKLTDLPQRYVRRSFQFLFPFKAYDAIKTEERPKYWQTMNDNLLHLVYFHRWFPLVYDLKEYSAGKGYDNIFFFRKFSENFESKYDISTGVSCK
jgi:hypothetical protein